MPSTNILCVPFMHKALLSFMDKKFCLRFVFFCSLVRIDHQLEDLMLALVVCAAGHQIIIVWCAAAAEAAFLHHLTEGSFGAHGGFLTLAICLPEANIVGEAVNMCVDTLFTFVGADLEAGHAVFLLLIHDSPAHPFRKLAA